MSRGQLGGERVLSLAPHVTEVYKMVASESPAESVTWAPYLKGTLLSPVSRTSYHSQALGGIIRGLTVGACLTGCKFRILVCQNSRYECETVGHKFEPSLSSADAGKVFQLPKVSVCPSEERINETTNAKPHRVSPSH